MMPDAHSLTVHEDKRPHGYNWLVTLLTLQGIANRAGPKLYLDARDLTDWNRADRVRRKMNEREYGIRCRLLRNRARVIELNRKCLRGVVVCDPKLDASRWVAVTLAGLEDLLPMTPRQLKEINCMLGVKHDLRGRWQTPAAAYGWAIRELLPRCHPSLAYNAGHSHDEIDMGRDGGVITALDYAVMRRGFVCNLSPCARPETYYKRKVPGHPEDVRLFRRVLSRLERPAAVYGWAEPEWTFATLLNEHGHYLMCGRAANLSFHAAIGTSGFPKRFQQSKPASTPRLQRKCYIAFMTSEGDTPRVSSSFFMGSWYGRARGRLPINWGMSPIEATEMPAHVANYHASATPNDYFCSGVGGAGYAFINRLKDPDAFIRHAAPHLRRSGMDVIEIWHNGRPSREVYARFARACNLRGIVHLPVGPCHVEELPGRVPIVFMDKSLVHFDGPPAEAARRIEAVAGQGSLPAFVPVYNTPGGDATARFQAIAEKLDPERFEPVRLDVMMKLVRQAMRRGWIDTRPTRGRSNS